MKDLCSFRGPFRVNDSNGLDWLSPTGWLTLSIAAVGTTEGTVAAGNDLRFDPLPAQVPHTGSLSPLSLTWHRVANNRITSPIDENFILWDDNFANLSLARYNGSATTGPVNGGVFNGFPVTFNAVGNGTRVEFIQTNVAFAIPDFAVTMDVAAFSGDATNDVVACGVRANDGTFFVAYYNRATQTVCFTDNNGGQQAAQTGVALAAPFTLALSIVDRSACVWIKVPNGPWQSLVRLDTTTRGFDFRNVTTLPKYYPYWFVQSNSGSIHLSSLRAGYTSMVGWLGQKWVTYEDGTPIIEAGRAFFTTGACGAAASAGGNPGDRSIEVPCCYMAVYSMDLTDYTIRSIGKMCFLRPGQTGTDQSNLIMGDNGGPMIWDRTTNQWGLFVACWGADGGTNNPVGVYRYQSTDNLLYGVHVLATTGLMALPSYNNNLCNYDPFPVKVGGLWHMGYSTTNTPGNWTQWFATHATTPDIFAVNPAFTLVGRATDGPNREGANPLQIGGNWYYLYAVSTTYGHFAVFDFTHTYLGDIASGITFPTHPTILPYKDGVNTRFLQIGFDGDPYKNYNYSWGNMPILVSDQVDTGHTFPLVRPPF